MMNVVVSEIKTWTLYNWIYIISMTLQIAGAISLLLGQINEKEMEEDEHTRISSNQIVPKDEKMEDVQLKIQRTCFAKIYATMYINRIAILYIALGYLMAIWGENVIGRKWIMAGVIVGCSIIVSVFTYSISKKRGKQKSDNKPLDSTLWEGTVMTKEEYK